MKSIGSYIAIGGLLAIILNFANMVPRFLMWIYTWGEGVAWTIKIGLVVVGGAMYLIGLKSEKSSEDE